MKYHATIICYPSLRRKQQVVDHLHQVIYKSCGFKFEVITIKDNRGSGMLDVGHRALKQFKRSGLATLTAIA